MFPMKFDHKTLETLPVPDAARIADVLKLLKALLMGRVLPYFKARRGDRPGPDGSTGGAGAYPPDGRR